MVDRNLCGKKNEFGWYEIESPPEVMVAAIQLSLTVVSGEELVSVLLRSVSHVALTIAIFNPVARTMAAVVMSGRERSLCRCILCEIIMGIGMVLECLRGAVEECECQDNGIVAGSLVCRNV